jgi:hypothetical protein
MGVEGMGSEPGTDAGRNRKPEKSGTNKTKGQGAGYRPEKEGPTMTQKEVEEKILGLLEEVRNVYLEYNPDGKQLNIAVAYDQLSAFNNYWDKEKNFPIDCYRRISE